MDRIKLAKRIAEQINDMASKQLDDFEWTMRCRGFGDSHIALVLECLGRKALERAHFKKESR